MTEPLVTADVLRATAERSGWPKYDTSTFPMTFAALAEILARLERIEAGLLRHGLI